MAEPAGRLNDQGRENDAAFIGVIAQSSDAIQEIAWAVRDPRMMASRSLKS
jgi:hypothetical protein